MNYIYDEYLEGDTFEDDATESGSELLVGIPTEFGTKNVNPELLRGYRDEAFGYLRAEATAKDGFKEVIETVAETTDIPKGVLSKWFKARFKEETDKQKALAASFDALDAAVEA